MDIEDKYSDLIEIAKKYMKSINDNEHNLNHMNDVVKFTKELLDVINLDINKDVCVIAAYWHDVGRVKLDLGHEELSSKMLREQMTNMNYDINFINVCCSAIENHKWNMTPKTIEGLILKDADKLAYLGRGRWEACLNHSQRLDVIMKLLPKLRNEILYFDESKKIYDREIIEIVKLLYDKCYNKKIK